MSAYSDLILADSPLVYYRLDEASGTTVTDSSGNANAGTYTATGITYHVASLVPSDADQCVALDGSSGSITCPTFGSNIDAPFTVEGWFWPNTTSRNIMSARGSPFNAACLITTTSSGCSVALGDGLGNIFLNTTHFGSLVDTSLAPLYIGVAVDVNLVTVCIDGSTSTASYTGTPALWHSGFVNPPQFGVDSGGGFYNGKMDELAIYTTALTAADMKQRYAVGNPIPARPTRIVNQAIARASNW